MFEELAETINKEWIRLYGGEPVSDIAALKNRIVQIAIDRDCWVFNAKVNQKEYLRLDAIIREKVCT